MRVIYLIGILLVHLCFLDICVRGSYYDFPKAAKHVPRIGRSKQSDPRNDAFEKFFLKASKSVPRIGRRGSPVVYYNDDVGKYLDPTYKRPLWSDISEKFEYEPEFFVNPQLYQEYETPLADDTFLYETPSRLRYKRTNIPSYKEKEFTEDRLQSDQYQ